MKKRNLGRIAALGLAGITAIPAISIVASADITFSKEADKTGHYYATGNATKVVWRIKETTHNYEWFDDGMTTLDNAVITDLDYSDLNKVDTGKTIVASNSTTLPLFVEQYYTNDSAAKYRIDLVKLTVDGLNKAYKEKMDEYNAQVREYTFIKNYKDGNRSGSQKITSISNAEKLSVSKDTTLYYGYVDPKTDTEMQFYVVEKGPDGKNINVPRSIETVPSPIVPTNAVEYSFTTPATSSGISSGELIKALGTEYISVSDNVISPATAVAAAYVLSATGVTGSTDNNGTTSGVYATPIEAIAAYPTATYSNASYRDSVNGYYWPNTTAMVRYYGYNVSYTIAAIANGATRTASRRYFDYLTNTYSTYNNSVYAVEVISSGSSYTTDTNVLYYNSYTRLYYPTYSEAASASGGSTYVTETTRAIPSYATFLCMSNGTFYSTYASALSAAGNNSSLVRGLNGATASTSNLDYLDPYYYYFGSTGFNRPTTTDTSAVTIGNRKGWTNVVSYAQSAKSGSSYNVSMNGETVVPSTVLSAIKGKNVTMNFTLKNGVVYSINGNDVSSAKELDIDTVYNTKNIPSKLISKAKSKNDGVSTSQLSIDGGSFGSSADVTVKFATKRAGCTARLYRYNADRNSLSLVSKSSVGSNGKCTFDDVTKGGDYVIVLS